MAWTEANADNAGLVVVSFSGDFATRPTGDDLLVLPVLLLVEVFLALSFAEGVFQSVTAGEGSREGLLVLLLLSLLSSMETSEANVASVGGVWGATRIFALGVASASFFFASALLSSMGVFFGFVAAGLALAKKSKRVLPCFLGMVLLVALDGMLWMDGWMDGLIHANKLQ